MTPYIKMSVEWFDGHHTLRHEETAWESEIAATPGPMLLDCLTGVFGESKAKDIVIQAAKEIVSDRARGEGGGHETVVGENQRRP